MRGSASSWWRPRADPGACWARLPRWPGSVEPGRTRRPRRLPRPPRPRRGARPARRIKPHFIYNALDTIAFLVPHRPRPRPRTHPRVAPTSPGTRSAPAGESHPARRRTAQHRPLLTLERARLGPALEVPSTRRARGAQRGGAVPRPPTPGENAVRHGLGGKGGGVITITAATRAPTA